MQESDVNKDLAKIQGYIKSIIDKERYIKYNFDMKKLEFGGHFLGKLYAIDVNGQTIDGDKEINLFIKQIVDNKEEYKEISLNDLYQTENFAYAELFKSFKELQDELHIISINERFETAKYYDVSTPETIILENLTKRGFITYHRMNVAPLKYAELCMQQLAKFHSFTFVLQTRRTTFFDKIKTMKHPVYFTEYWDAYAKNMYNITISYLEDDVRSKVAQKISDIVDQYPICFKDTTTLCTLCHGDYRQNNILVKEMNGEASEVIPVDFQFLHYGSPIHDILFFIFLSTDHKFRGLHLEHLKNLYFQNLTTFLEHFQIDVESVYPRAEFEKDFKKKLVFGLMINVLILPFVLYAEDDVPDVTKDMSTYAIKIDEIFRERFRGTVEEFIKWGYL